MKHIITISLLALSFSISFGQQDPEAKEILDKLSEKTKAHNTISADFKVSFKNIKENIQNSSEGSIAIKGEMYRLDFMNTIAYYDGTTLWNYLPDVKEVNITEPDQNDNDIFNNPRRLFTIYEEDYKYQLINQITEDNVNYSIIDLYPIDINEDFSRIRLQINTDKYFLSSATIFGKDGSHYSIVINNYLTNQDFDNSYFIFDKNKYPDVEVVDMRF